MADAKNNRSDSQRGGQALARGEREPRGLQAADPWRSFGGPLEWFERMTEDMDRVFDDWSRSFGLPRRGALARSPFGPSAGESLWSPRIEAFHKGDKFIVRAELPGLKKDDVQVELAEDTLTIRGERRSEHEEERGGFYHSERQYGTFHRSIPLPGGVIGESANATFRDGMLEVSMDAAPAEANRGRRLEIKEGTAEERRK